MFGSKCGRELRDDEVFCSGCGNKVIRETTTTETSKNENNTKDTEPKYMKRSVHLDMIKSMSIF